MKLKLSYIIPAFAAALALNACKKDKGNYDYTTVNIPAIDTAGIGGARFIERYGVMDINPRINYAGGDTAALTYRWIIYPHVTGSTPPTEPPRVMSQSLHLASPVIERVGEYRLELIVTDSVNGLKANVIFPVTVSVGLEYGVMVLHGNNDSSDVDFLITADAVPVSGVVPRRLRGLYAGATGAKLAGIPRFVAQERRVSNTNEPNWIVVGSNRHISRMKGQDFSLLREDLRYFRRPETVLAPEAFMYLNSGYGALINGGKLHMYNSTYELDAVFSGAVPGDYDLAPYFTHATSSSLLAAVYDKKFGKFIHPASVAGSMIDFKAPTGVAPFDLRNIGKDMLYMDRGFSGNTHAFFKDRTGVGYWLYVCNFNKADDGNMAVAAYNMTNLPEIAAAKYFQASELGYVDFYATDRKVYAYDYFGANTSKVVFDGLPAGETITCMKIYKPRPNFSVTTAEGRLLYIATWDGTQGRVYEFALNGVSGDVTLPAKNVSTGYGQVYDITAKNRGSGAY
ncbi:PKD-like family lipoprotein [Chitinophaga horti]|uniref:PKD-like family lipoprotein n=1 Tax=Chitinophaga horti TaxID=2920382 RepID=A0ABY6J841_9BACT|nr:PKD-like family lipoprotein [Chitinophaga horti]UYQ95841.1 PKD-like family lipoprotein [Chitinophaga horti]